MYQEYRLSKRYLINIKGRDKLLVQKHELNE